MELMKVLMSCLLLMVGLIIGVVVNYYGLVFEAINVHVQVATDQLVS